MQQAIDFIEAAGAGSITALWIPMGIWSIVVLILMGLLRLVERMEALYHYHVRAALILSLPAGITGLQLIKWAETTYAETVSFVPAVWIIESPMIGSVGSAGQNPAGIEWLPFLTGTLLLFLVSVSLLQLVRLITEAYLLSSVRKHSKKLSPSVLSNIDSFNLRLLNSIRFKARLIVSSKSTLPFTHGGFRPLVVIPKILTSSRSKMNMAVRHELIHIKRGDYILNYLLMLTKSIFWFNPILYYLLDQLQMYREISCDKEVLNEKNISRKSYAELLVELSSHSGTKPKTAISMSVHPSNLKKRIQSMKTHKKQTLPFRKSLSFFTAIFFAVALVMSFSNVQGSKTENSPSDFSAPVFSEDTPQKNVHHAVTGEIPELIGGLKTFQTSIRYPEEARQEGVEGLVVVQFTITDKGEVEEPQLVRGIGGGCDEEALKTVQSAKFKTGKTYSNTTFQYSFLFRLAGSDVEFDEPGATDGDNLDQEAETNQSAKELGRLVIVGYGSTSSATAREEYSEKNIVSLTRAIERTPGDDSLYHTLGNIYLNRSSVLFEKRNQARDEEEAQALDRKAREVLQKAMNFYEKAVEIDPENTDYWQNLYRVYVALGMKDKAASAKEKVDLN